MRALLKAVLQIGGASLVATIIGVIASKMVAVIAGPSGVGALSLIKQFQQTAMQAVSLNSNGAIVQAIACRDNDKERFSYLASVAPIIALSMLIILSLIFFLRDEISRWALPTIGDGQVVGVFVVSLLVAGVFSFHSSVLNGYRKIGTLSLSRIAFAVGTLIVAPLAAWRYADSGMPYAFIGMIIVSTLCGGLFLFRATKSINLYSAVSLKNIRLPKGDHVRHFISFVGLTTASTLYAQVVLTTIRGWSVQYGGLYSAGILDVAYVVSMNYLMFFLTSFGTYFMPQMASVFTDSTERHLLYNNVLRVILVGMLPLITTLICAKEILISLLYTNEFQGATQLMRWMFVGDFLKLGSWALGMTLVAGGDVKVVTIWNIAVQTVFLTSSYFAMQGMGGVVGVGVAYDIMYALNFVFFKWYAWHRYGLKAERRTEVTWGVGLAIIIIVSWFAWDNTINPYMSSMFVALSLIPGFFLISRNERHWLLNKLGFKKS